MKDSVFKRYTYAIKIWLIVVTILGVFSLMLMSLCAADIGVGKTEVAYTKAFSDSYELSVATVGDGVVYDEDNPIRDNGVVYQLPIDESKIFKLVSDKNIGIVSIVLNGHNITDSIKNNYLEIQGQEYNQSLVVTFKKSQTDIRKIITNDVTRQYIWLFGLLGSITLILLLLKKKREWGNNCEKG